MPSETSNAIVLKTVDFSESSLIVTLFTREFGKISGIAKGGRRLKNPFEFALDLVTQISVTFIRKNSEALDLLTEAKLLRRFRPSSGNLEGLYSAYYVAELLDLMTEKGDPAPSLYDLAAETLDVLETGRNVAENLHRFEWGLLDWSGQKPATRFCVSCGDLVPLEEMAAAGKRVWFAFLDGGVVCPACRQTGGFQQIASVAAESLRWLDRLDRVTSADEEAEKGEKTPSETLMGDRENQKNRESQGNQEENERENRSQNGASPWAFTTESIRVRGEIRGLLNFYFCSLLGRKPRLQYFLKN